MNELVSIIMPSYNTANYIGDAIMSVLTQTYSNWELIIVDDCSTDDSISIINSYKDPRIKLFINKTNSGAAFSRNVALKEAKGRWIAFLDSDDMWFPRKLEKQVSFMENNGYAFSYTSYLEMDEYSKSTDIIVTGPKKVTKKMMYYYCWPGCLTVMYDAETIGLIQIKDIKKNNDYAMWLKICWKANCYYLDECLAQYRIRSNSISNTSYFKLIKWHYYLFREAESLSIINSLYYSFRNMVFGIWKKIVFRKKVNV